MDSTGEAYSRSRYGEKAWKSAIVHLLTWKYTEEQVREILLSKYMRWAGDSFAKAKRNGDEKFDGSEIIQYRRKWGIDIDELMLDAKVVLFNAKMKAWEEKHGKKFL
jgi:hypothetical protein